MIRQLAQTRDQRATALIEDIVRRTLRSPAPTKVAVSARDNHSGEPSLYVNVTMTGEEHIPDIAMQNRLSGELLSALQANDDDRFPYVYFGPFGAAPQRDRGDKVA